MAALPATVGAVLRELTATTGIDVAEILSGERSDDENRRRQLTANQTAGGGEVR